LNTTAEELASKLGLSQQQLEKALAETLDHTIYLAKHGFRHVAVSSGQRFCTAPLLIRAAHKAHALNVLVKERLMEEAETILRILIEVSFVIAAISKESAFVRRYAASAYVQKNESFKIGWPVIERCRGRF